MTCIKGRTKSIIDNQYIVARILVHSFDVSGNIGLPLATIIAIGTLKSRLLATLVTQMPSQSTLPHEDARTVRTLVLRRMIADVILHPFPGVINTCEQKDNSTWLLTHRNDRVQIRVSFNIGPNIQIHKNVKLVHMYKIK